MIGFRGKNVEPAGSWRFVASHEKLQATDLVRYRHWTPDGGYSDYIDHDIYKYMNWATVETQLPVWVGKSVDDLNAFAASNGEFWHHYDLEVIRKL